MTGVRRCGDAGNDERDSDDNSGDGDSAHVDQATRERPKGDSFEGPR